MSARRRLSPWLLQRAAATPERLAVACSRQTLDYGDLARAARSVASCLRGSGARPGDAVALLLGNGLPFVIVAHACLLSGLRLVPLNVRLTTGELLPQLRLTAPAILLCDASHEVQAREAAAHAGVAVRRVAEPGEGDEAGAACPVCGRDLRRHSVDEELAAVEAGAVAAVIFTSGSTGRPKGVCLSHASLLAAAAASAFHLGASASDRWLACLPLFHVGGLAILVRTALQGSAVLLHERFDAARLDAALASEGPTLLSLVPTMLARLLDVCGERPAPSSLRALLLGGAPPPPGLVERARVLGYPVLPTYGLTEAGSQVAAAASRCRRHRTACIRSSVPGCAWPTLRAGRSHRARRGRSWCEDSASWRATSAMPRPRRQPSATAGSTPAISASWRGTAVSRCRVDATISW